MYERWEAVCQRLWKLSLQKNSSEGSEVLLQNIT